MPHDIRLNMRSLDQDHLASGWVAFIIFNTAKRSGRVPNTVEYDFNVFTGERRLKAGNLLSQKSYSIFNCESPMQILNMLRRVQGQRGKRYSKLSIFRELVVWQNLELPRVSDICIM